MTEQKKQSLQDLLKVNETEEEKKAKADAEKQTDSVIKEEKKQEDPKTNEDEEAKKKEAEKKEESVKKNEESKKPEVVEETASEKADKQTEKEMEKLRLKQMDEVKDLDEKKAKEIEKAYPGEVRLNPITKKDRDEATKRERTYIERVLERRDGMATKFADFVKPEEMNAAGDVHVWEPDPEHDLAKLAKGFKPQKPNPDAVGYKTDDTGYTTNDKS